MEDRLPVYQSLNGPTSVVSLSHASGESSTSGILYGAVTLTPGTEQGQRKGLFESYGQLLERRPLRTLWVTNGIVYASGSIVAQLATGATLLTFHIGTTFFLVMFGVVVTTPLYHTSYVFLERHLPTTRRRNVLLHLLVDQLVLAPIWVLLYVLASGFVVGETTFSQMQSHFVSLLRAMWIIYPAAQTLNFSVVPPKFRLIFLSALGFLFTCYLTYGFKEKHFAVTNGLRTWSPDLLNIFR